MRNDFNKLITFNEYARWMSCHVKFNGCIACFRAAKNREKNNYKKL